MYVCLCNRITDSEIRCHGASPGCTPAAVYRAKGVAPRCGKCIPMVSAILRETQASLPRNSEPDTVIAPAA